MVKYKTAKKSIYPKIKNKAFKWLGKYYHNPKEALDNWIEYIGAKDESEIKEATEKGVVGGKYNIEDDFDLRVGLFIHEAVEATEVKEMVNDKEWEKAKVSNESEKLPNHLGEVILAGHLLGDLFALKYFLDRRRQDLVKKIIICEWKKYVKKVQARKH